MTVYTIGHSTHSAEEFLRILRAHSIELLADIRTIPRSRRNPQFESAELGRFLSDHGMEYTHLPGLGGLRHARKDSINTAWQNDSFRGYADYMQTTGFEEALQDLIEKAKQKRTAVMCAEAVPWRCHRSLVADALVARGFDVLHILSEKSAKPHILTGFAHVDGLSITYPNE